VRAILKCEKKLKTKNGTTMMIDDAILNTPTTNETIKLNNQQNLKNVS